MCATRLAKNLSRFHLITFDITDTLLRFTMAPAIQYAKTASSFGYSNINQLKMEYAFKSQFKRMKNDHPNFGRRTKGMGWRDWWVALVLNIFDAAGANIPSADVRIIADKLIEQYKTDECWWKVDGADEIVSKIKGLQKKVGVISNFDPSLHQTIRNLKLPEFDFVLTSYEQDISKPDPRLFESALELCGAKKEEALHIGNTLATDYYGAISAGWSSIHISNSSDTWEAHADVNRDHVFESIRSLLDALENKDISWTL